MPASFFRPTPAQVDAMVGEALEAAHRPAADLEEVADGLASLTGGFEYRRALILAALRAARAEGHRGLEP